MISARWAGMALWLSAFAAGRATAQELRAGIPAPEIDLATLGGGRVKLSRLRGHPVVVTFWGTWCPPCREEFPELVKTYQRYRGAGLEVVAVNQRDQELRLEDVEGFVREYAVEFPVALDPRGHSRRSYRLIALPTTVFIDTAGMVRQVHSGPIDKDALVRGLAMILPAVDASH